MKDIRRKSLTLVLCILSLSLSAQQPKWSKDGSSYYRIEEGEVNSYSLPSDLKSVYISKAELTPLGQSASLTVRAFYPSDDGQKVLIYTNTKKVWRQDTEGDYWVLDKAKHSLKRIGTTMPASSLRFAKFSPDGTRVAYVSQYNLYVEDLGTGQVRPLAVDPAGHLINGTFDWVYEEELDCRDGFQWSPDGNSIAYWQIDAAKVRDYLMINTTDSAYSRIVPVEYPTVGQLPSSARIGVVNVANGQTTWLAIPGDPQQNYLPRLEWHTSTQLLIQQLNRKQNQSTMYMCQTGGSCNVVSKESDNAWIDVKNIAEDEALMSRNSMTYINKGTEYLWLSDKDGWSHVYRVSLATGKETLVTVGEYDVTAVKAFDEKNNKLYFMASPQNATQRYLHSIRLDGKGDMKKLSPAELAGVHDYRIAPGAKFAYHTFSNSFTKPVNEFISLPDHKALDPTKSIAATIGKATEEKTVEFFTIKTEEGVTMDAWVVKPKNFDSNKKYPVVFQVYTEPAGQTAVDRYGVGRNRLYEGSMRDDGYLYVGIDNRGTPSPKGAAWRKSVYRKIGRLNIHDQAMAAKEILKWPYADPERVAVHGWSGGGSATLNLLFQYPEIYKTGIAVAAVANQLTYDNIYQERYMGLPSENLEDFVAGSPITYAKNLQGNLLYIHGTGDDNVHYNNAEMLVNELVKHKKIFQFMPYPNRAHGISEGEGTSAHLSALWTDFLKKYCPPGGRETMRINNAK